MEVNAPTYFSHLSVHGSDPSIQYTYETEQQEVENSEYHWDQEPTIDASRKFPIEVTISNIKRHPKIIDQNKMGEIVLKRPRYRIAYLILAHKNKENLFEMFKYLYSEDAIFLFHIDANSLDLDKAIREWTKDNFHQSQNIYFVERPFHLQW